MQNKLHFWVLLGYLQQIHELLFVTKGQWNNHENHLSEN